MKFFNKIIEKMATNPKLFEIANTLINLTVLEAKELIDILENDYGIKPAKNITQSNDVIITDNTPEPLQTEFDVILKEIGLQKLKLIKRVKELKNLNLIDAKTLVESAPCKLEEKTSDKNAAFFKTELELLGAVIEVI